MLAGNFRELMSHDGNSIGKGNLYMEFHGQGQILNGNSMGKA
jgi:hypothetical protein